MVATTRWTQYDVTATGTIYNGPVGGKGTRGYSLGKAALSAPADQITIGPTTNKLYFQVDGGGAIDITMISGSGLDPRFLARDISKKMQSHAQAASNPGLRNAVCWFEGGAYQEDGTFNESNAFKFYSGSFGSGSQITISSGVSSGAHLLGFGTKIEEGGLDLSFAGGWGANTSEKLQVSGTNYGFLDDCYKVVISNDTGSGWAYPRGIQNDVGIKAGGNTYDGVMTTGGVYTGSDDTYSISINVTGGTTMGGGTGNVPVMSWTSTPGNDNSTSVRGINGVELLYPDHWYYVGTKGLKVKFSDAVFNGLSPAWTIACYAPTYAEGTNASASIGDGANSAEFVWSSERGDDSSTPSTTSSGNWVALGTRGLYIKWDPAAIDTIAAGKTFYISTTGPIPDSGDAGIASLNYGNVTVSSESPVKCVAFEVMAGAIEVSTVKFGLENRGSFEYHNATPFDTRFRFGTMGPANDKNGYEWYPNVLPEDIDSDTPPSYLYATKANLEQVTTADASEAVGAWGVFADPIWLCIKLGASETGANSTINQRLYFDYS